MSKVAEETGQCHVLYLADGRAEGKTKAGTKGGTEGRTYEDGTD
jgi:hypothetical protein